MARNGRVIDVNVGDDAHRIFASITRHPLTRRLEARMAKDMREAIARELANAINDARQDGSMPYRTGRGYRQMLAGCRSFGVKFRDLRGHILGPAYMVAHERGSLIEPKNSPQLAVPLPAALKPDGSPKLPGPRSWQLLGSFIYKSKKTGRGYIARKDASGQLVLLYVFVDSAQLAEHEGFMTNAWERRLPKLFDKFGQIFMEVISDLSIIDQAVEAGARGGRSIRR